ncbi:MAG: hypothetical protein K2H98_08440 [Duncaniella sp.]|nr:hypothetical protein [Duncaniella sp.]
MRNILLALAAPVLMMYLTACSSDDVSTVSTIAVTDCISVNKALKEAPELVDSIVSIHGQCAHICDYSAFTAYIMGHDSVLIRCVATPMIGGYFPDSLEKKQVIFDGMLRDQHLNIEGVHNLDEQYRMHMQILRDYNLDDDSQMLDSHRRCEYERRYRGQEGIVFFDESTSDYRKRIEQRTTEEGKDYLTFYYLQVTSYQIVE